MAENIPTRSLRHGPKVVPDPPPPPDSLSAESRAIWTPIVAEWLIGPEALPLLRAGLEQWDLYQRARAVVASEGPTVVHPETGNVRAHPAAKLATDALREFRMCFRQLGLEPPKER